MRLKAPFKCKASFKLLIKMLYWTNLWHLLILVSIPDILYMNSMPSQPMPPTHRSSPNRCLCSYAHYLTHHHLIIACFSVFFYPPYPQIDLQSTSHKPTLLTLQAWLRHCYPVCKSLLSSARSQYQYLTPKGTYQHTANSFSMCCPLTWVYQHTATLTATVKPSWPDSCA